MLMNPMVRQLSGEWGSGLGVGWRPSLLIIRPLLVVGWRPLEAITTRLGAITARLEAIA